jgi:hypothetical protein
VVEALRLVPLLDDVESSPVIESQDEDKSDCNQESPYGSFPTVMAVFTCILFLLDCLVFLHAWDTVVNPPSGFRDAQSGLAVLRPIMLGFIFVLPCFLFTLNLSLKDRAASHQKAVARDVFDLRITILCGGPVALAAITGIVAAIMGG